MEARLTAMIELKIGNLTTISSNKSNQPVMFCDFYSGGYLNHECPSIKGPMEQIGILLHHGLMKRLHKIILHKQRQIWKSLWTLGTLPSNTKVNPREYEISTKREVMIVQEKDYSEEEERTSNIIEIKAVDLKEDERKGKPTSAEYKPKVPLPNALVRDRTQECMRKFIEIFKQLKINLPLCDLLLLVPRKPKEKGKHLFPKIKTRVMKWMPVRRIEEKKPKKHMDFRDPGGAFGT
ncbi:hypothetical protein M9H77_13193 [Catharanthus roseus]|uniref:Uncharacterized protein n=1 Tax=Catharanthus roseus TaxID=4058 RepID=A0ACC0BJG2_CATRO|nr:hypothetical protein M9H77_13193 [Catharanthus roseus]